jgi:hypothetical protein
MRLQLGLKLTVCSLWHRLPPSAVIKAGSRSKVVNDRPIIGILTQVSSLCPPTLPKQQQRSRQPLESVTRCCIHDLTVCVSTDVLAAWLTST